MHCEMKKLTGKECSNDAFANITVSGSKGRIDIDICEQHLNQLTHSTPTQESDVARQQRERSR